MIADIHFIFSSRGELQCKVSVYDDLAPHLCNGIIDDTAFLDAVGRWDAATKGVGNALDAIHKAARLRCLLT